MALKHQVVWTGRLPELGDRFSQPSGTAEHYDELISICDRALAHGRECGSHPDYILQWEESKARAIEQRDRLKALQADPRPN